jgi:DNA-binding PadR family transcriptional regulator
MVTRGGVTPLGLAVLELLHSGPMHPYEMHQTMRTRHTDRIVKLKAGSLYHAVERLERVGLVEIAETSRTGRRPERTVYAITGAGRKAFAEQVADLLAAPEEEFPAYALAVGLSPTLDRATVLSELGRREDELTQQVATDRAAVERLQRMELPARYWLDVRLTLAMREAELAWTSELIGQIESGRLDWPTESGTTPPNPVTPPHGVTPPDGTPPQTGNEGNPQ